MRRLGPIAGAAQIAARRDPGGLALIDELGELSYGELDRRANALGGSGQRTGSGNRRTLPGSSLGRDAMIACGKLGVRLVLPNTGFSRIQLVDAACREGVSALVHDEEFDDLLSAVPAGVRRLVAWGTVSELEG